MGSYSETEAASVCTQCKGLTSTFGLQGAPAKNGSDCICDEGQRFDIKSDDCVPCKALITRN